MTLSRAAFMPQHSSSSRSKLTVKNRIKWEILPSHPSSDMGLFAEKYYLKVRAGNVLLVRRSQMNQKD
jgi:hypothetical protein